MFRFTIRDVLWLTLVAALGVGWWLDRSQLAFPVADYRRLKAEEAKLLKQRMEFFKAIQESTPNNVTQEDRLGPDGLHRVPGDKDYQFPPEYPLHYDYRKLP